MKNVFIVGLDMWFTLWDILAKYAAGFNVYDSEEL